MSILMGLYFFTGGPPKNYGLSYPDIVDTPKSLTYYQTWRCGMREPENRRKYDREFKEGAVRLILDRGRTVRSVAEDLGIHENETRL